MSSQCLFLFLFIALQHMPHPPHRTGVRDVVFDPMLACCTRGSHTPRPVPGAFVLPRHFSIPFTALPKSYPARSGDGAGCGMRTHTPNKELRPCRSEARLPWRSVARSKRKSWMGGWVGVVGVVVDVAWGGVRVYVGRWMNIGRELWVARKDPPVTIRCVPAAR
jgi:hypothetical protein